MAESTSLAASPVPAEDIERAEAFAREPFVLEGEEADVALAEGTARRRALDASLKELDEGNKFPTIEWRREYALLLGLERILSQEEPVLADGTTTLNAHQVDALSGTLIALTADIQAAANARENAPDGATGANGNNGPGKTYEELPSGELEIEGDDELSTDDEPLDWDQAELDAEEAAAAPDADLGASRRFWFEHATGAGKTVAAMGFVEASRTGGVLILTHRRNLVEQFNQELKTRGYQKRVRPPLLNDAKEPPASGGPVTVETYQWFVRNAGNISDDYTIVICDEAHTALGEKTSAAIRKWKEPIFIGMTATGALIARHVTDLFPTQTSRFDLGQAARRGVIAPLRCVRIPPGTGVRSISKVPLRKGEVDQDFDQEELAELLDQTPFNLAIADLYKTRFKDLPGVVYSAGVRHAHNVAEAFVAQGIRAKAVSGETKKRELTRVLAAYERGEIDVLVNAQLLAEGWNSPRATVCMHLAPTASKRIYQQRVGRVTRRRQGKEAGIVVDFVHPATTNDDPVVTLHSLLDRDVYRGGAIVVGPVRRGRGRRLRVERRVLPVTSDHERRAQVFERELWRIAVEHLDWDEKGAWSQLAGARVAANNWRRAKAMLAFDATGELRRKFLVTCLQRNRNAQLRVRALQEVGLLRDPEAFDSAVEIVGGWSRDERHEGVKTLLQSLAEKPIGRRDQASRWLWHLAEYSRDVHEEYAVSRWPETKRLLGLLVNSSGGAHARNARRLVQATRKQDRRLAAALLAASPAHTPEAQQVLDGARMRMARKPSALARELLRNFPKGRRRRGGRRRKGGKSQGGEEGANGSQEQDLDTQQSGGEEGGGSGGESGKGGQRRRRRRRRGRGGGSGGGGSRNADPGDSNEAGNGSEQDGGDSPERGGSEDSGAAPEPGAPAPAKSRSGRSRKRPAADNEGERSRERPVTPAGGEASAEEPKKRAPRKKRPTPKADAGGDVQPDGDVKPRPRRKKAEPTADASATDKPKPRSRAKKADPGAETAEKPKAKPRAKKTPAKADAAEGESPKPKPRRKKTESGDDRTERSAA